MEQSTIADAHSSAGPGRVDRHARRSPVSTSSRSRIAMGCVVALGLWAATAMLLVKGAPPGRSQWGRTSHCSRIFCPGYSVSWPGSVVGLFYGFLDRLRALGSSLPRSGTSCTTSIS